MPTTGLLYDPVFLGHAPPAGHPESPRRLQRLIAHLDETGLAASLRPVPVRPATAAELHAVHDPAHLARLALPGERWLDPDTYRSAHSWEAAIAAAGAVCAALEACRVGEVRRAFCAVRPPGHHAETSRAMGFCLVNNVAVGARHAQRIGYARVMIADFDVHHGNGTQEIFYGDDSVFYFSTHQYPHYPGTGASAERGSGAGVGFTRNIPLPAGSGDDELLRAWRTGFAAEVASFQPDCCLVSAGYDLHAGDPLAGFAVTDEGVRGIVRGIADACAGIPVVLALEGGYHPPTLARCVAITLEELLR